jgi:dTDP-4-dehydrorhamnose 3,5-epimerase-like enzyme
MKIKIKKLDEKKDSRGSFVEILRSEEVNFVNFGQISLTTAFPGEIKGKHYHKRKTEWYCVIKGNGLLTLIDNTTKKEKKIRMGEKNMVVVEISPNIYHFIENVDKTNMYLLLYITESYNPEDPDTFTLE